MKASIPALVLAALREFHPGHHHPHERPASVSCFLSGARLKSQPTNTEALQVQVTLHVVKNLCIYQASLSTVHVSGFSHPHITWYWDVYHVRASMCK